MSLDALESKYPNDALNRLVNANQDYYSTHGDYLPELARLLLATRASLEQAEERERVERDLVAQFAGAAEQAERERDEWENRYEELLAAAGGTWPG